METKRIFVGLDASAEEFDRYAAPEFKSREIILLGREERDYGTSRTILARFEMAEDLIVRIDGALIAAQKNFDRDNPMPHLSKFAFLGGGFDYAGIFEVAH